MKLKTNFKLLLVFGIIFVSFLLFNTNAVQAKSYSYDYDYGTTKGTVTVTVENKKLTQSDSGKNEIFELDNLEEVIGFGEYGTLIMKQTDINKFNTKRDLNYTIKKKLENDITSVTTVNGETIEIQTINNEKWLIYNGVMKYEPINIMDNCKWVLGYKNNDIRSVLWGDSIEYYENNNEKKSINITFDIITEVLANQNDYVEAVFVNKRGVEYEGAGGAGGGEIGYVMLNPIFSTDATKYELIGGNFIPTNVDLKEVYLKIEVTTYQGEKIVLENDKGTLYYEGIEEKYGVNQYIYKNRLSDLKLKENEIGLINYKLKSGVEIPTYLRGYYKFDSNAKEEVIKVEDSTKNEQNIKNEIGISYWGDAEFNINKIEKSDIIYEDVKNEIDKNSKKYQGQLYLSIVDIYRVSGNYGGKLTLTFNVGEQYNGKYYYISHRIRYGEFEQFEGIVENGKIQIVVDSLSPFGISIFEKEEESTNNNTNVGTNTPIENEQPTQQPTNKGEKDETPKTGSVDIIGYVSIITLVSMVGIITLKKKLK